MASFDENTDFLASEKKAKTPKKITKPSKKDTKPASKKRKNQLKDDGEDVELVRQVRKVKGVSKEVVVKRKISPKKKKSKKQKRVDFTEFTFNIVGCFLTILKEYILFAVDESFTEQPDIIGFDIGDVHLGITGLKLVPGKRPIVTHFCLLSQKSVAAHDFIDYMVNLISFNPDFYWVKNAPHIRIEQQFRLNTRAQVIAGGLRGFLQAVQINNGFEPDVKYVNAEIKYSIGPMYSAKSRSDPLRLKEISGSKGKVDRKVLGEHDCKNLLELAGEDKALEFLNCFEEFGNELHDFDICDSYLIASDYELHKDGPASRVKKATKKRKTSVKDDEKPTKKRVKRVAKRVSKKVGKKVSKSEPFDYSEEGGDL
jgi:hypothetical protein